MTSNETEIRENAKENTLIPARSAVANSVVHSALQPKAAAQAPPTVPFPAVGLQYAPPVSNMNTSTKGRKRTLTLVSGENVDLATGFSVTAPVIDAMRKRIFELEDEIETLRQQPPTKRARTVDPSVNASAGPSSAASSKVGDDKKRKMQLKKIFDQVKRQCKSDDCKFQGSPKTIKFDEVLESVEFDMIFKGKGVLIQPTPENKPKSVVTIMHFNNLAQIRELFGDELKALKGNRWTRGGFQGHRSFSFGGFGGSSNFAKSVKTGACDVEMRSLEVQHSKNNLKCTLKFTVAASGSGYGGWDSD